MRAAPCARSVVDVDLVELSPDLRMLQFSPGQAYAVRNGTDVTLVGTGPPGSVGAVGVPAVTTVCFGHGAPLVGERAGLLRAAANAADVPDPLG
jgi:hypothetical protein